MTLKQAQVIKELPNTGYNIAESMRRAKYAPSSVRAGTQYRTIRKLTRQMDFLDPERITADIDKTYKQADKIPELRDRVAAKSRIEEHRAKLAGMIIDKSIVDNNPDKIVITYGSSSDKHTPDDKAIPPVVEKPVAKDEPDAGKLT